MVKPRFSQDLLLRAIAANWPEDKSTAGLTLAWLPDKQCFYGAIVRYEGYQGANKQVVYKATGKTVRTVTKQLAKKLAGV